MNESEPPRQIGIMAKSNGPYFSPISESEFSCRWSRVAGHHTCEGWTWSVVGHIARVSVGTSRLMYELLSAGNCIPCMVYGCPLSVSKILLDDPASPESRSLIPKTSAYTRDETLP